MEMKNVGGGYLKHLSESGRNGQPGGWKPENREHGEGRKGRRVREQRTVQGKGKQCKTDREGESKSEMRSRTCTSNWTSELLNTSVALGCSFPFGGPNSRNATQKITGLRMLEYLQEQGRDSSQGRLHSPPPLFHTDRAPPSRIPAA